MRADIRDTLDTLPASPGVYVFKGEGGVVLYVGKARSLRSRVRSYFQPGTSDIRAFVARLEAELESLETYVTQSEKEAALLENQIIKREQPRYNVKLRDDKEYLSLRLRTRAEWPRLEVVRRPKKDGAQYFGPYHSATAARQTLRLVNRHFRLRTCTDSELRNRSRPCLQYQIKRCPGPCVIDVDRDEYAAQVRDVGLFLSGRHDELVGLLEARMKKAAAEMAYEQAAVYRDQLKAVASVKQEQRVSAVRDVDQDVLGLHRQDDLVEAAFLQIRRGRLSGVRTFGLSEVALPTDELIAQLVLEYYGGDAEVPDEVLLPMAIEAQGGLEGLLTETRGKRVSVMVPKRATRARLLEMARENAEHAFHEKRRAQADIEARLVRVQKRLRLPAPPERIECVDISHTGGEDTVAAIVSLHRGEPERARYRNFKLRGVSGGDDYAAMYEVLSRRVKRGRDGDEGWSFPNLLVVDGGKGQLRMAEEALRDLGVTELPIAALAKEKEDARGERLVDRVYLPGQKNPIVIRDDPALRMLALARDEAHRASNRHRKKIGARQRLRSELDDVPGVGPKTRARLLTALGSLSGVLEATLDELMAAGATRRQAQAIQAAFGAGIFEDSAKTLAEQTAIDAAFGDE